MDALRKYAFSYSKDGKMHAILGKCSEGILEDVLKEHREFIRQKKYTFVGVYIGENPWERAKSNLSSD